MTMSLYTRLSRRFAPERFDAVSRRAVLAAGLAASAGLLLSGPARAISMLGGRGGGRGKRVVVIGAGFGGLACAYELLAAGYDVTVVEARGRVGGRVLSFNKGFSEFVPGKNVEGGGELVGSNHPTWMAYAEKFGLKFLDIKEAEGVSDPVVIGGKRLTDEESEALYEEMDKAFASLNDAAKDIDEDEPWKSKDAAALDKRNLQSWIDTLTCGELGKKGLSLMMAADNGVEVAQQSFLGNLTMIKGGGLEKFWTDSEVYRCDGGNDQIASKLAEAITMDRIILGLPVTEVATKGDGMLVTCKDGRTIECDDVVCATPPTVWKKMSFKPGFPESLRPQMGINVKYLARVKNRFWREKKLSADAFTDELASMTWEATEGQGDAGEHGFTAFSGGKAAERARNLGAAERKADYAEALEGLYPGFKDAFVDSRFMDWPGDQWVQASYSFPAPGQVTAMGPTLRNGYGRLHFAGEHCCYKFVGYMEGALNSGASLARRIAERDGVVKAVEKAVEKKKELETVPR